MPVFGKKIENNGENKYDLSLIFSLHDQEDKISPYDIDLEVLGSFSFINGTEDEINDFLNITGIAILFPYLRGIISTTMSAMLLPPIVLPIVDAKKLFNN